MPLFYFHVHDGVDLRDDEGTEFPTLSAARDGGLQMAGRLLAEQDRDFWNVDEWSIDIEDDAHQVVYNLRILATEIVPDGSRRCVTQNLFRAVQLGPTGSKVGAPIIIKANTDLGAVEQARQSFEPSASFVLWQGDRHVLSYRPPS